MGDKFSSSLYHFSPQRLNVASLSLSLFSWRIFKPTTFFISTSSNLQIYNPAWLAPQTKRLIIIHSRYFPDYYELRVFMSRVDCYLQFPMQFFLHPFALLQRQLVTFYFAWFLSLVLRGICYKTFTTLIFK